MSPEPARLQGLRGGAAGAAQPATTRSPAPRLAPDLRCEHALADRVVTGELVDGFVGDPRIDSVSRGPEWGPERSVRAEFIADLLRSHPAARAIVLQGVRITGALDLETTVLGCPLLLDRCRIDAPINLMEAKAAAIRLKACDIPAIAADQLDAGELDLDHSRVGVVSLVAATIRGELSFQNVRVGGGAWPIELGENAVDRNRRALREAPRSNHIAVNADRLAAGAVVFDRCWADGELRLAGAHIGRITFNGAQLAARPDAPALSADGIRVEQEMLFWRDGRRRTPFRAKGEIRLTGARIGTLSMSAAELESWVPDEPALVADGISADVGIHLNERFSAQGAVTLRGARTHLLNLAGARLRNEGAPALLADRLTAHSGVFCEGLQSSGEVAISDASIGGELNLCKARISNPDGTALAADRLQLEGRLFARGCHAEGTIALRGAHVAGMVNLDELRVSNAGRTALQADQLTAGSGMSWRRCSIEGMVKLPGARVRGRFRLERARFSNPGMTAFEADELSVEQYLRCDGARFQGSFLLRGAEASMASFNGAKLRDPDPYMHVAMNADGLTVRREAILGRIDASGTVRLCSAHVGVLSLERARLAAHPEHPDALLAEGLTVDRGLNARGLQASGTLALPEARVGGQFALDGAALGSTSGSALRADGLDADTVTCDAVTCGGGELALSHAQVAGKLTFIGASLRSAGSAIRLDGAKAGTLNLGFAEEPPGSVDLRTADIGTLVVSPDGGWWPRCRLSDCCYETLIAPAEPKARVAWLQRDPCGFSPQPYEQLAAAYRRNGRDDDARRVAIARHRERRATLGLLSKLWGWFLDATVGYGHRPWQAGFWLVGLLAVGSLLFGEVYEAGGGSDAAARFDLTPAREPAQTPQFQPVIYTVDALVPVISLGQRVAWNAMGAAQWTAFGLTICGWLLTSALVAGLAVRRQ